MTRAWATLGGVVALGAVAPALAFVLGGGDPRTDCWAAFDGVDATYGTRTVRCADGDRACDADGTQDGACTFRFRVCVNVRHVGDCQPRRIRAIYLSGNPPLSSATDALLPRFPTARADCGAFGDVVVPLRRHRLGSIAKPGRLRLRLRAVTNQDRVDSDRLTLLCSPPPRPSASGAFILPVTETLLRAP